MSIPIKSIVAVAIGIASKPLSLPGFGNLLFLTDEAAKHVGVNEKSRVWTFNGLDEVTAMFPVAQYPEINAAATSYYAQKPTPTVFMVGAVLAITHAGYIQSANATKFEAAAAITAGTLTLDIDSVELALTGIDLSGAKDLNDVAIIIDDLITAKASCVYDDGVFTITSNTKGAASLVGKPTGTVLEVLGMVDVASFAGLATETPLVGLSECEQFDGAFNEVVSDKKWRDSDHAIALSDRCQATDRIFGNTTNNPETLTLAGGRKTHAGIMDSKANSNTFTVFASNVNEYPSCSGLGRINTVNYQGTDTTITLMFKKLPTITAEDLNTTQVKALKKINVNVFTRVGDQTSMFTDGRMAGGGWLDNVHGIMWLTAQTQLNVFNLFYVNDKKVPFTDDGIILTVQQVDLALRQAVRNGLVAPGLNAEGEYLPAGYVINYVPITGVSAADKGNRIYQGITFECVGAGALHGAVISGSFNG